MQSSRLNPSLTSLSVEASLGDSTDWIHKLPRLSTLLNSSLNQFKALARPIVPRKRPNARRELDQSPNESERSRTGGSNRAGVETPGSANVDRFHPIFSSKLLTVFGGVSKAFSNAHREYSKLRLVMQIGFPRPAPQHLFLPEISAVTNDTWKEFGRKLCVRTQLVNGVVVSWGLSWATNDDSTGG